MESIDELARRSEELKGKILQQQERKKICEEYEKSYDELKKTIKEREEIIKKLGENEEIKKILREYHIIGEEVKKTEERISKAKDDEKKEIEKYVETLKSNETIKRKEFSEIMGKLMKSSIELTKASEKREKANEEFKKRESEFQLVKKNVDDMVKELNSNLQKLKIHEENLKAKIREGYSKQYDRFK